MRRLFLHHSTIFIQKMVLTMAQDCPVRLQYHGGPEVLLSGHNHVGAQEFSCLASITMGDQEFSCLASITMEDQEFSCLASITSGPGILLSGLNHHGTPEILTSGLDHMGALWPSDLLLPQHLQEVIRTLA